MNKVHENLQNRRGFEEIKQMKSKKFLKIRREKERKKGKKIGKD